MAAVKSSFLDKVLGRINRLDQEGLQTVVQRLARERTFLETLFNSIEDGVLVVDEAGRILYFNQAVTRLLGLQPATEGRHVHDLLPELDWKQLVRQDTAGGRRYIRHEFEVEYPRPRFLRLYAAPLDGDAAGSSGLALILHDATESRQQTFEAIESERIQALTLLAASVAHEIGNPLNALHIHLQLMERELKKLQPAPGRGLGARNRGPRSPRKPDAKAAIAKLDQFLGVAKGEIHRLDYIVTQFLQAIRPTPLQIKAASLNTVVQQTLELLRPELDNRGIHVRTKLARSLPESPLDATRLQQALVNLVKNAMQAMTRGGTLTLQTGAQFRSGVGQRERHRLRHSAGANQSHLRAVLHHQKNRHGSGPDDCAAHHSRARRPARTGEPGGARRTFRIALPLHEKRTKLLSAPATA